MKLLFWGLVYAVGLCQADSLSSASTTSIISSTTTTLVPTLPTATLLPSNCCPNGTFTGLLSQACVSPHRLYGDGQCYGEYQINCRGIDPKYSTVVAYDYLSTSYSGPEFPEPDPGPYGYPMNGCLDFCRGTNKPFLAAMVGEDYGFVSGGISYYFFNCYCASIGPPRNLFDYGISSLSYCPTGVETPPPSCCEPYTDNLSKICTATPENPRYSNYGNRKCLPGGYQVGITGYIKPCADSCRLTATQEYQDQSSLANTPNPSNMVDVTTIVELHCLNVSTFVKQIFHLSRH
jgi:hypothetical protein